MATQFSWPSLARCVTNKKTTSTTFRKQSTILIMKQTCQWEIFHFHVPVKNGQSSKNSLHKFIDSPVNFVILFNVCEDIYKFVVAEYYL